VSVAALVAAAGADAADPKFKSPEDALRQGIGAFHGGYYEIALPALEAAAASNLFLGQYYLARLYADNSGAHTDHAKAYVLFQQISNEHTDADPDDDSRAPYVARSLTALARYVRQGLPEIGLAPNPERAAEYLRFSATFFNDEEAQFELAKVLLYGETGETDVSGGMHWLSTLSQKGHAGGQAFLALELWRGKLVQRDPVRALALIAIAIENAPPADRLWIGDIYQDIFCGSGASTRKQVTGMVADWRDRYGRKPDTRDRSGLGQLAADPVRLCRNGEPVAVFEAPHGKEIAAPSLAPVPQGLGAAPGFLQGGAAGTLRGLAMPGPDGLATGAAPREAPVSSPQER